MIKIITAINNPKIIDKIREEQGIEVISNDIIYQEGIFEILEKYKEIHYIIISEKIYGNLLIEELIEKINEKNKQIKIILQQNSNEKRTDNKHIYKIINEKTEIKNLIKILKNEKVEEKKQESQKIITILGTRGIGKSIFATILAKTIAKNEKILILDLNRNISAINRIKSKNRINKNIEIKTKEINFNGDYKYIIIDTYTLNRKIIENTDIYIFLLGGNIIEIKKAKKLLKLYTTKYRIKNIKLVINKYTEKSIDYEIIKNIFNEYKTIGKINYSQDYDLLINKKVKRIKKDIKREYNSIIKKIKSKDGK